MQTGSGSEGDVYLLPNPLLPVECPRMCPGCQFGPRPDFAPDDEAVLAYRAMRFQPDSPMLVACHRYPTLPCAGLLREMALRPRSDGDYYSSQTALAPVRRGFLHRLLACLGRAS